ncbi:hypothetical protein [Absidia glauca]|uniref:Uncharacterized protein n=1 Tax=Absidia glauca TaxID=4829 RepID=A0A163JJF0_ABSGL|nr:hypothetical protein [Absidia glauca]
MDLLSNDRFVMGCGRYDLDCTIGNCHPNIRYQSVPGVATQDFESDGCRDCPVRGVHGANGYGGYFVPTLENFTLVVQRNIFRRISPNEQRVKELRYPVSDEMHLLGHGLANQLIMEGNKQKAGGLLQKRSLPWSDSGEKAI